MIHFAVVATFVLVVACMSADQERMFQRQRELMVANQLVQRGIKDERVLRAMQTVPRHAFVPLRYRDESYSDCPLPLSHHQTISQPYIVAIMTELAQIEQNEKVLEIGTGSGYQAAVLSELCDSVYSIEIIEPLGEQADAILDSLGYSDVRVKIGDGFAGWQSEAPFDAIIVTCAPSEVPRPLIDQLADDGRLVIPVGDEWQELRLIVKKGAIVQDSTIISVRFVPMTGPGVNRSGDSGK
jgi:protein-L-isoaspartate(D-aspartate) O-methyltransferase